MIVPVEVARRLYPEDTPNFADFLMTFPGIPDDTERDPTPTRSVDL